ncbi:hypothetical protein R9C00_28475 [Flammeovirgaceae bacterium SG7u.111]|nr:hypothetical protein [Flammeovirgaceae bacterium SG7u.132]WPO35637.1 hypothetical protein R9C00_28475 [Flammeovirgaceae bacterium SG7u.111]
MFELTNLLDLNYCTEFVYLSDNATDIHFRVSFGVTLVFKQKKSSGILEFMEGKQGEFVEVKRQTVLRRYCLKKIRWYNLDTKEKASLDEEVLLNHIKYNILDRKFEEGNRVGQAKSYLPKEVEILLEEGMSLEDY